MLLATAALAQDFRVASGRENKFAEEMSPLLQQAHEGRSGAHTVDVIVQYGESPRAGQESRMLGLGARLNHRLSGVKGMALTIPLNALPALENDPEIVSVSLDHPLRGMDEYSNAAMNVSSAWTAGL